MSKQARYCQGKIAVVTGAGSGIGRAIARRLGRYGARVHCADIDAPAAERVAGELADAAAHTLDVTDAAAVAALADKIYAEHGRVDLLFNNAGIGHAGLFVDTELADWRRLLEINVMGVVHGVHAFLPRMQRQGGASHIVNTASGAGIIPIANMAPYCATKYAVVGLSQSLAAELHGTSIGVTILCPGTIDTDIVKNTRMRGEAAKKQSQVVDYYAQHGVSPDRVAADVLTDVIKGRLICVTPRAEVGPAWLLQRLSPPLVQVILRRRTQALWQGRQ